MSSSYWIISHINPGDSDDPTQINVFGPCGMVFYSKCTIVENTYGECESLSYFMIIPPGFWGYPVGYKSE